METISVNGWGGETGYRHGDNAWVGGWVGGGGVNTALPLGTRCFLTLNALEVTLFDPAPLL